MSATQTSRLVLGTVQLGLKYGINNQQGQPASEQAFEILQQAADSGINILDSAEAYGGALAVIGKFTNRRGKHFRVISKFSDGPEPLASRLDRTLELLCADSLYAYMYHRYSDYSGGTFRKQLHNLRHAGKIDRIGVSLYHAGELSSVLNDGEIELIQIPLNVLDASNEKLELIAEAKSKGKEIHVRSVFLQGLFFKNPASLTGNLISLRATLEQFKSLCEQYNVNALSLCLSFALKQKPVDHVLIGVETQAQLVENIDSINDQLPDELYQNLHKLKVPDGSLLNPSNWKP